MTGENPGVVRTLAHLGGVADDGERVPGEAERNAGRLEDAHHYGAGLGQPGCDGEQERAGSGDRDPGPGHHPLSLEQGLDSAGGEDSGQGPPRERQLPVVGARRDDDGAGQDHAVVVGHGRIDAEPPAGQGFHLPHGMSGEVPDPVCVPLVR